MQNYKVILPIESKKFLYSLCEIESINPYLLQNRFIYEKTAKNDKKNYYPLLYSELSKLSKVEEKELNVIPGKKFCNENLIKIAENLNQRNLELAQHFPKHSCYKFKPYDKMIIGEGGDFYLNMQPIRLHPLYGLPYIPASAIKGALRSAWVNETSGSNFNEDIKKLFGSAETDSEHTVGTLIFFDTFPKHFSLSFDVQTPHFKNYYEQKCEPSDDRNPVPIPFVCLKDANFNIIIACRDEKIMNLYQGKIDDLVSVMFTQYGIGAKSSLGYGLA